MREEKEYDNELELVLQGKSEKVRIKLNILKYLKKLKSMEAGVGIAIGVAAAYGGMTHYYHSEFMPDNAIKEAIILIIFSSIAFMLSTSADTHFNEESYRKGLGSRD